MIKIKKVENKVIFENQKEKEQYLIVINFILSFYKTKKQLMDLIRNINYHKNIDSDKNYPNFKKEMESMVLLLSLEHPEMQNICNEYYLNKNDTFISICLYGAYKKICDKYKQMQNS